MKEILKLYHGTDVDSALDILNKGLNAEKLLILYKHRMEKILNSIKHLITYSDTCTGQNRNINVAIMFLLAIEKHPTLQIIDHCSRSY